MSIVLELRSFQDVELSVLKLEQSQMASHTGRTDSEFWFLVLLLSNCMTSVCLSFPIWTIELIGVLCVLFS